MLERAEGVVLRTTDYGETNKIVTVLTKEFGKIGLMARGAKKPKSRLGAVSQTMTHVHVLFRKSRGLGTLSQGETIDTFKFLKKDIRLMAYGTYIVDLTDQLTEQRTRVPSLYHWVLQLMHYMDEGVDPRVLTIIFEVKMLPVAGIDAHFDACAICGGKEQPFYFSIANGGFLCRECCVRDDYIQNITPHTARLLRLFKHIDLERLGNIDLKQKTIDELDHVITQFYEQYSGLRLKTKKFIRQVDQLGSKFGNN